MNRKLRRIARRIRRSEPARRTGRVAMAAGVALLAIVAGTVTWAALTRF
jgi:CHASE3 domain sensor protein